MNADDLDALRRERERMRKRKKRAAKRGRTLPCDLCGCVDGPELHRVSSLQPEVLEKLCQVTNTILPPSARVCCQHFEDHPSRLTQGISLTVKTEFASLYYLSPSTRPPPTPRAFLPPIPREPTTEELKNRLTCLQKKNQHLEDENYWLRQRLSDAEDEIIYLRSLLHHQEAHYQFSPPSLPPSPIENRKEVLQTIITSDYKYWCGFSNEVLQSLIYEWQEFGVEVPQNWELNFFYLIFLLWLRQGWTFVFLAHFVKVVRVSLRKHFFHLIERLQPWCMQHIGFPSFEEWSYRTQVNQGLCHLFPHTLFFFVDGTVVKIWAPEDSKTARAFYNQKHGYHAYVFFIVVTADGKIVYISDVRSGTEHDKTHWNESDAPDQLEQLYCGGWNGKILSIGGDKAYRGIRRPIGWENRVTKSAEEEEKNENENENEQTVKKNKEWWCDYIKDVKIARHRAVVERTIGAMKKWLILTNEPLISRVTVEEMRSLLVLIAALTNYQLITNNTTW